jgi:hypothetical protein
MAESHLLPSHTLRISAAELATRSHYYGMPDDLYVEFDSSFCRVVLVYVIPNFRFSGVPRGSNGDLHSPSDEPDNARSARAAIESNLHTIAPI